MASQGRNGVAIRSELGLPIRLLAPAKQINDMVPFDRKPTLLIFSLDDDEHDIASATCAANLRAKGVGLTSPNPTVAMRHFTRSNFRRRIHQYDSLYHRQSSR